MEDSQVKVLLIEDNPGDARLIREMLAEADQPGFDLEWVDRMSAGLERLAGEEIDVILTDLNLPDSQGLDTVATMRKHASGLPVVMLTSLGDQSLAIHAMQAGAQDYLVKGETNSHSLVRALRYAIERKQAEEALRESKRLLDATGTMGKIGGWEHDLTTGKAVWTQALYHIIEIPFGQEPPGVDEHLSYYPPGDRKTLEQAYGQAVKNGTPFDLELQVHTSKQKHIWCRVQGEPVYENGKCVAMRGIFQDITERIQTEQDLRESEERYRSLFNNATEGILVAELASKQFYYANPAICRILGYSEDELLGMSVLDIHPKESLDHVISEFEAQARGEKALASGIPCLRKDGGIIYADISTGKVVIRGVEYNVGLFTDISERKRAEEALRDSYDKLEQRVAERTAELRKLVNAMAGREVRMAELKDAIRELRAQLEEAGLEPVANDPLLEQSSRPGTGPGTV